MLKLILMVNKALCFIYEAEVRRYYLQVTIKLKEENFHVNPRSVN